MGFLRMNMDDVIELEADRNYWKAEAIKATAALGEIKIAEAQGLYIKLPFPRGINVWDIHFGNPLRCKVCGYEIDEDGRLYMKTQYGRMPSEGLQNVFETRELAEEVLKSEPGKSVH